MTEDELLALIARDEGQQAEFKAAEADAADRGCACGRASRAASDGNRRAAAAAA